MFEGTSGLLLLATAVCIFAAFALLVFGIVPDEVDEEDIYGYRLTKRKRLLEENGLYATTLPMIRSLRITSATCTTTASSWLMMRASVCATS